jgi:membrane protease YdiL (CAAX protease family)
MTAMTPARRFTATVLVGWTLLALAAVIYTRMVTIPAAIAIPLAAAFLIEFPFYLLPAFSPQITLLSNRHRPLILAVTCVVPYLVYSIPTGEFRPVNFALLAAIALILAFWFALLPKHPLTDFLFLAAAASVYISKVFDTIFISPIPKLQLATLGHLMLIRTCALAVLTIRGGADVEFRFLPTVRELRIGLLWFLALVPACALALRAVKLSATPHPATHAWLILPQFIGILWVVALSEEFAFRGLLQQWFETWTSSPPLALIAASVLFGCAHLGFLGIFPNWRFAIVASVFGLCCGLAWRQSRTIQSAMITHALGATLYRVFFW